MRQINEAGMNLIKSFESFSSKPYLDAAGNPTIGYGTRFYPNQVMVKITDSPTDINNALLMLDSALNKIVVPQVDMFITANVNSNVFSACCCLAYNIGIGAFKTSSVLKYTNEMDLINGALSFALWNEAKGVILPGLIRRRAAETVL